MKALTAPTRRNPDEDLEDGALWVAAQVSSPMIKVLTAPTKRNRVDDLEDGAPWVKAPSPKRKRDFSDILAEEDP